jgi:hypothetical protein
MDIKAAFSKMKSQPGATLHFFFCEQGEDGKPLLIMDNKPIPSAERSVALAKAKKKNKGGGRMEIDTEGELKVTPLGSPPSCLAKGLQIVARNHNCMPKSIKILKEEPEQPETSPATDTAQPGTAPTQQQPQQSGSKKPMTLDKIEGRQKRLVEAIKKIAARKIPEIAETLKDAVLATSQASVHLRKKEGEQAAAKLDEASQLFSEALNTAGLGDENPDKSGGKVGSYDPATGLYGGNRPKKPDSLKGIDEADESLTAHHLYPWNQILKDINDGLQDPSGAKMKKLLAFGETDVPAWFWDDLKLAPKDRRSQFGDEVNKAAAKICWSPSNIFMGPRNTKRGDDPGEKLDVAYTQSGLPTPQSALAEMIKKKGGIGTDDKLVEMLSRNVHEAQGGQSRPYTEQEWIDDGTGKRVRRTQPKEVEDSQGKKHLERGHMPIKEGGGVLPKDEDKEWTPAPKTGSTTSTPKAPKQVQPKLTEEEIQKRREEAEKRKQEKATQKTEKPKDDDEEIVGDLFGSTNEEET